MDPSSDTPGLPGRAAWSAGSEPTRPRLLSRAELCQRLRAIKAVYIRASNAASAAGDREAGRDARNSIVYAIKLLNEITAACAGRSPHAPPQAREAALRAHFAKFEARVCGAADVRPRVRHKAADG